jgi:hypothetical protein
MMIYKPSYIKNHTKSNVFKSFGYNVLEKEKPREVHASPLKEKDVKV